MAEVPDQLIALAERLADETGEIVAALFRTPIAVTDKPDESPVTEADRGAETRVRAILQVERPDDGIIGEEFGSHNPEADWVWVIDPIDGTKAFITGRPMFGTLIGLLWREQPVLGIINQPWLGDRWLGVSGRSTTLNGHPTRTRPCPRLDQAVLSATHPDMFVGTDAARFAALSGACKLTLFGGDCYAYGLLAAGFQDIIVEAQLKLHDMVALVPILAGAGGAVVDWAGQPLTRAFDGRLIAVGDPALLPAALDRLSVAG